MIELPTESSSLHRRQVLVGTGPRESGLAVAAWTVREPEDYRRLEALGLVAICVEAAALDG